MGSVYRKAGKWYLEYIDERGRRRNRPSAARTKTEGKRLVAELERLCERQRLGLEPMPLPDGGGTLGSLMAWWLEAFSKRSPSHKRNVSTITKNVLASDLAGLRLVDVTAAKIENHLLAKENGGQCGPQTINHIRTFLMRAFNRAIELERFVGKNPALAVRRRKVPKRKPDFLREDEVRRVLAALDIRWRPLFATAIYTGMRKGELLGLKKADLDFTTGLITVRRSHQRDGTKGEHEEAIPIAAELAPYLRTAVDSSPSGYVFPKDDSKGSPMRADVKLEKVLRRAMARAGIVQGYEHVCRRKGAAIRRKRAMARSGVARRTGRSSGPSRLSGPSRSTTCATRPAAC